LFDHLVRFPIPIPQGPCLITAGGAHQAWSSTFTVLTLAGNFGHQSHSMGIPHWGFLQSWGYPKLAGWLISMGKSQSKIAKIDDDWG